MPSLCAAGFAGDVSKLSPVRMGPGSGDIPLIPPHALLRHANAHAHNMPCHTAHECELTSNRLPSPIARRGLKHFVRQEAANGYRLSYFVRRYRACECDARQIRACAAWMAALLKQTLPSSTQPAPAAGVAPTPAHRVSKLLLTPPIRGHSPMFKFLAQSLRTWPPSLSCIFARPQLLRIY